MQQCRRDGCEKMTVGKWCSEACRSAQRRADKQLAEPKPTQEICGRYLCDNTYLRKSINHRFCSETCRVKAEREKGLLTAEIDPVDLAVATNERVKELERQQGILQRALVKEETRTSVVLSRVEDYLADYPNVPVEPLYGSTRVEGGGRATEMHLCLSDTQAGKWENGIGFDVLINDYLPRYAEKAIRIAEIQRQEGPVDTLYIHALGDLVEGCRIYPGQRNHLDRAYSGDSQVHQVLNLAEAIAAKVVQPLRSHFREMVFANALGNHGRNGTREDPSLQKDNNDYLVARIVQLMCSHLDIKWVIPEEDRYAVSSLGWNIGGIHGHQFRSNAQTSIEPVVLRWDAIRWFGKPLDVLLCGHLHHAASVEMQGIEFIRNAAADGGSEWYTGTTGVWSPPSQELFFVSREFGIDSRHRLHLAERMPRAQQILKELM